GEGTRTVAYADLYELCETLDLLVNDDPDYERLYFYITSLLVSLSASDMTLDALGDLEGFLDYLDPDQAGMTITVEGNTERYVLGKTTVFEKTTQNGATSLRVTLPNSDGYTLTFVYDYAPGEAAAALKANLTVTAEQEERLFLDLAATGLPLSQGTQASGSMTLSLGGTALATQPAPLTFDFRYSRDAAALPYQMSLAIDLLHPTSGKPALSMSYLADMEQKDESVLVDHEYDNQDDFFHLNESFLEEYKERFLPSLALAFLPIVLEMPAGAIDDLVRFATDTGILASLGIE
ncbi:MAG: hypothetical protein RSC91_11160, partial [Clostridia bacterium]